MSNVAAKPCLWERKTHLKNAWGTTLAYDIRGETLPPSALEEAVETADAFADNVNRLFSPYLPHSVVNLHARNLIPDAGLPADFREVVTKSEELKRITQGCYDPWGLPSGVNFTGFVKGWAAERIARIFVERGFANVCVNAAGDVWCAGYENPGGEPWTVGLQHPTLPGEVFTTVTVTNQAVCTSGTYINPTHLINPATQQPVSEFSSVTVVGGDGGYCDGLASAVAVAGVNAREWFPHLPQGEWSAILVRGGEVIRWESHNGQGNPTGATVRPTSPSATFPYPFKGKP